ncbi:MAG TPA: RagB/SusD family nutrient uptake outer membrane protein [Gemmatimonadales bacterium]|nr:RagB/SusD family nutrient uptake outer membrane protein [Gemmatimonadales bacterium]
MNCTSRIVVALWAGLVAIGCTDLLTEDPQGFTTTDTFYKTGADLNSGTIATYNSLRGLQGQGPWTTLELASDQARADSREPNAGTYGPDRLDYDASTGLTGGYWTTMYSVITRANLVLAKAPDIETGNTQTKTYNVAEARFLRGYAYVWLTKVYDGVPLLLTPEEQANPRPERTPVEQVHQAIIQDLTAAEADLPSTWPSGDGYGNPTQGRATKGAAQMALADLYLWRSSFMGTNEWQQASDWAKKVIDSGRWSLQQDYLSTFLPKNKGNGEMIFMITNSGVTTNARSLFQLFYYPRDWGLDQGQGGGWGLIHPTTWFWNSYPPGDYRRTVDTGFAATSAYVRGGCSASGLCPATSPAPNDTFADGPMPYKYRKTDNGLNWMLNDIDTPLFRYAEAILIYAEAQNELGNSATAITYLNMIRARARQGTGAESRPEPHDYTAAELPDQPSVRDAIFMERMWEFAFEAKRWFDLVRRDSESGQSGYWMTSLLTHDPNANLGGKVVEYRKRFPIPQGQITANPSLCQNTGYGGTPCPPGIQP